MSQPARWRRGRRRRRDLRGGPANELPAATVSPRLAGLLGPADRVVVVDCETTGVFTRDRVVEVGMVTLDRHGTVLERWETLVNPGRDAGPSWLHGITGELLAHAPTFDAVAGALAARLDGAVLAAHNLPFDTRMLAGEFAQLDVEFEPGRGLDTLRATRGRLGEVCHRYGIEVSQAHRALNDAEATAQLLLCVADQLDPTTQPARLSHHPPASARTVRRDEVAGTVVVRVADPPFVARTAAHLQHRGEDDPAVVGYLELLDRALANLHIDADEASELAEFATEAGLEAAARHAAHRRYLDELIDEVLTDHAITDEEYDQLVRIAAALEIDQDHVHRRTRTARTADIQVQLEAGMRVCFTGEVEDVPRSQLSGRAQQLGLEVQRSVTKSTDLLLAADPSSGSGKADKARRYGIPIARADLLLTCEPGQSIPATTAQIVRRVAFTCQRCHQTWTVPARTARRQELCTTCRDGTSPATPPAAIPDPVPGSIPTEPSPPVPVDPVAPAAEPTSRTETLTCQACGRRWQRELKRGRKPRHCPDCR